MMRRSPLFARVACSALVLLTVARLPAAEIRHRFLAVDESRSQLHYVDQFDSTKDWTCKLDGKHRDLQLVGGNRVLLATPAGFREYDLGDRRVVREVTGFKGGTSARRLPDGRTILACNTQGVTLYEIEATGRVRRQASFPVASTRVVRLTPQGTLVFGSTNRVFEADLDGTLVRTISLPEGAWAYQALRRPNGHLLITGGLHPRMYEAAPDGTLVETVFSRLADDAKALGFHLLEGFQLLAGGDLVICNWTGHGANDSNKGAQLIQYNSDGRRVWQWHDPVRAGSINGVIILDDLDPAVLNDDSSSVLQPVRPGPRPAAP